MTDGLLTAPEVAERLNVPVSWVRQATRDDLIPHVRLGRYRRYSWAVVEAWLQENGAGPARRGNSRNAGVSASA